MSMVLKTRVFELWYRKYSTMRQLARAMGISECEVFRVRQGKRGIHQAFIVGALRAFPEYKFEDLFFVALGESQDDRQEQASRNN
ncbi:MAG: hypothetical protein OEZ00_09150 [Dehalococcoidia bacterium]|nr:hypothetical protein [Dehalococcoidia bacterium]